MAGGEVIGQTLPKLFAVGGPALAALLELDDAAADLPIGGGEDGIDRLGGGMRARSSSSEIPAENLVIVRELLDGGRHVRSERPLAMKWYRKRERQRSLRDGDRASKRPSSIQSIH